MNLTTIFADFERSGKNNAEGDLEWMSEVEVGNASHASNKSRKNVEVTITYAYALFN